jgi:ADP-heptose:LPS heptosyltransferase
MRIFKQQIYDPIKLYWARFFSQLTGDLRPRPGANPPFPRSELKRILVTDRQCIGDVIMLEPVLSAIREYFSSAELDLLCVPALKGLAAKAGLADRVYAYPREAPYKIAYDMIFNFHPDRRQLRQLKQYRSKYRAGFSFSGGARYLTHITEYPYWEHQVKRPFALLDELFIPHERQVPELNIFRNVRKDSRRILLHAGANDRERRWPTQHWRRLVLLLTQAGYHPCWIGIPGERSPKNIKEFRGDLLYLAETIAGSAMLIGCDSMAVHLSAALRTPALAIFGSQDPALTGPYGPYGHFIAPEQSCDHQRRDWRLCAACMASVTPEQVADKVLRILEPDGEDTGERQSGEGD